MFSYCPSCASKEIRFIDNKVWRCAACQFTYYHNTAAATACIIQTGAGLLFLVRNKEPGKGKLDLPGGFVDPGEGAVECIKREIMEELSLDLASLPNLKLEFAAQTPQNFTGAALHGSASMPNLKLDFAAQTPQDFTGAALHGGASMPNLTYFASFPNKYPYKNIMYNTCDLFFILDAPNLSKNDIQLDTCENSEIRFIKPCDIVIEDIAFESIRRAVQLYLQHYRIDKNAVIDKS